MMPDFLSRKRTHFLLWRPRVTSPAPQLVIGTFQSGDPPQLANSQTITFKRSANFSDLWELKAAECGLQEDQVYHYWFHVGDGRPTSTGVLDCTDPTAMSVDWRLCSPPRKSGAVGG